jgi:PPK2 family polyphosphate:nucleotide phosphotransferase
MPTPPPTIRPLPLNKTVDLGNIDPSQKALFKKEKKDANHSLQDLCSQLADFQRLLYAEHKHALLIILQGMDTSGKNGTIRSVFHLSDPVGVHVASFTKPSTSELDHDFLWRIHAETPRKGDIKIFDRSHYEDITAVRVHDLAPESVWSKHYDHINAFERLLTDEGTTIIKFYLNIDRKEQKRRLESRMQIPEKRWKFDASDLHARSHWDDYMDAYNDALQRTNKSWARWYVIPSNHKWLRNLLVAGIVVRTMEKLGMEYPQPKISREMLEFE